MVVNVWTRLAERVEQAKARDEEDARKRRWLLGWSPDGNIWTEGGRVRGTVYRCDRHAASRACGANLPTCRPMMVVIEPPTVGYCKESDGR